MSRTKRVKYISMAALALATIGMPYVINHEQPFQVVAQKVKKNEVNNQTIAIIHFEKPNDKDWALWVWPEGGEGQEVQFTGTDAFGQYAVVKLSGSAQRIGFLAKSPGSWSYQSKDAMIDVNSGGLAQGWLDKSGELLTKAPEGKEYTAKNAKIRYHYVRAGGDYDGWNLWTWASGDGRQENFNGKDSFGVSAEVDYKEDKEFSKTSFIVKKSIDCNDWSEKDIEEDRAVTLIPGQDIQDVWLVENDKTIYYNQALISTEQSIKSANIEKMDQIVLDLSKKLTTTELANSSIKLVDNDGNEILILKKSLDEKKATKILLDVEKLDLKKSYQVKIDNHSAPVGMGAVVRTDAFDKEFAYDGQLGSIYTKQNTTIRLLAPTASKVELVVFDGQKADSAVKEVINMTSGEKGTYESVLNGDNAGLSYQYRLTFPDGTVNETGDPYATAAVVNGDRSVVLSPEEMSIPNFNRMASFTNPVDAVIYEAHIRDFSISPNSGIENKGKFLGVVESGTKNEQGKATGLDYLKKLGITHVQFLPMYDYQTVDESKPDVAQFNWGYDPKNYNVPEGSYSTNANNPSTRIVEMKEMVNGLHNSGLRVIMDVVYNHVYSASSHAFSKTVPGYYFRYTSDGKLSNGTGVGNDTASERAMMRKYIVDSVTYWAKNYNLDGFRFDLMGIHDIETMKEVRAALDKIDPSIIVLGEGWI